MPRKSNTPPTVFHWIPYLGSAISFGKDPVGFLEKARAAYGDVFTIVICGRKVTYFLGAEGNSFVFNSPIAYVSAAEAYSPIVTPVFGKEVVFDCPNAVFMEQKRMIKFGLTTEQFREYVPLIEQETRQFLARFSKEPSKMDLSSGLHQLILMTASHCLMGKEVRAMVETKVAPLFYDLDQEDKKLYLTNFSFPFKQHNDMIQHLMEQSYKNGMPLPAHHVAHLMIALLFGGQHTSSSTSCWAILELARRPDLICQIREELNRLLPFKDAPLTLDIIKQCKYLESAVRETLRLHPPLGNLMRKVVQDLSHPPTGYVIPKGTYIGAANMVNHIDPRYFDKPRQFDPSRWERIKHTVSESNAATASFGEDYGFGWVAHSSSQTPYLPFGAGRHRCIGEQFGYVQLKTVLATFIRTLDFKLTESGFPSVDPASMVSMPVKPAEVFIQPLK
ncbi:Lanosterol 14-alpha-demethylase [Apophysomyces ossiformis]|uniref:Lanosterol 14-alpha-demethylase n=1 Tax=Apophysomyces ossiformis TaxID=679940 RepID=A0A8H7BNB3_9FUNG|nr:Lanosterol 14-alpha-demethylase [Apophysomyces ossiformis]